MIVDNAANENGVMMYLVKWRRVKEPTWQPWQDLSGCMEVVKEYLYRSRSECSGIARTSVECYSIVAIQLLRQMGFLSQIQEIGPSAFGIPLVNDDFCILLNSKTDAKVASKSLTAMFAEGKWEGGEANARYKFKLHEQDDAQAFLERM